MCHTACPRGIFLGSLIDAHHTFWQIGTMDSANGEEILWKGHPSQMLNFWTHVISGLILIAIIAGAIISGYPLLLVLGVVPLGFSLWKYLTVRCRVYELTSERIRLYEGVLNQDIDEVELYRVKDTAITRPFWLRIFGLSRIKLDTSDRSHPLVLLEAIKDGVRVRELLRKQVEILRDKKRVREVDFDGSGAGAGVDEELGFDSE